MDKAETVKAKEAERHTRLRLKRKLKNELAKLRCLHQFLCNKYKSTLDEFESGYDEGKNEYVAPQTRTSSSSQTDPWNILDQIALAENRDTVHKCFTIKYYFEFKTN